MPSFRCHTIVLIGAGRLGIRHLEGLLSLSTPASIVVVDPNAQARRAATAVAKHHPRHQVQCEAAIPQGEVVDLAIIATTSRHRADALRGLLQKNAKVRYVILEKVLFDRKEDYAAIRKLLAKYGTGAWVNCPLRLFPFHHSLKKRLGKGPISYHVAGGARFGLMTNAVHYADFMGFLTGMRRFRTDTTLLAPKPIDSRRTGFKELIGSLIFDFAGGSRVIATTLLQDAPRITTIIGANAKIIVNEKMAEASIAERRHAWRWRTESAPFLLQSAMTGKIAVEILRRGTCQLPTFEESAQTHLSIFEPVGTFLRAHGYLSYPSYPFT